MKEIRIPDFLKPEYEPKESNELGEVMKEYKEKVGKPCFTEGLNYSSEELIAIFRKCIDEHKSFYEVIGYDSDELDEDDVI